MDNLIQKYKELDKEGYDRIVKEFNISEKLLEYWEEQYSNPNLENSLKICKAFNITLDDLYGTKRKTLYFSHLNDIYRKHIYEIYYSFVAMNGYETPNKIAIISKYHSKIAIQRKKYGDLSQEKLADELGVTRSLVKNWEGGDSYPPLDVLFILIRKFDVSLEYFTNDKIPVDEINIDKLNNDQLSAIEQLIKCYDKKSNLK